jgi:hypothetical protein
MTKSTSKRVQCVSCGETYPAKRPHICDFSKVAAKQGTTHSIPQKAKSAKLAFGKGGRR